ncbi:MAG: integrase [Clostridia bacterium]|nr:integrase [Clostridia bacterium]
METDTVKYFNTRQIALLRRQAKNNALVAKSRNQVTAIREWVVIDVLTSTGMRVSEVADLRCGDLKCGYGTCEIYVRNGKGGKSRTIQIQETLKTHLRQYITWKANRGESVGEDDFLFVGQRGPWTRQAIQQIVKKYLKQNGLYEKGKSVHALRHSYATELYRNSKDLRAVQKQLGHASITTTMVYADVTKEDIGNYVSGLWRAS